MPKLPLINLATEGITYKVDFDYKNATSPEESDFGTQQPARATRRFLVDPWSKRHIFLRWLLGEVAVNTDTTPHTLTRTYPQRHPLYLSLWADRVTSVKGFKQAPLKPAAGAGTRVYSLTEFSQEGVSTPTDHKLAEYKYAVIDVEYMFYKFRPMGDGEFLSLALTEEYQRYTELTDPRTSAEFLTLPGMVLYYTRDPAKPDPGARPNKTSIPYGVGKILPLEEFTMIWHRVPYEAYQDGQFEGSARTELHTRIYGNPWAATPIKPYIGTVNRFPIFGRPAETLLFSGFQAVRRFGPIPTSWEWDLHYTFTYDPNRWNWKYYFQSGVPEGPPDPSNKNGWYFVSRSNSYPASATDPTYGAYLNTQDEDSLYNTRNHAYLFRVGAVS